MNKAWELFDRLAEACVKKEITFAAFVRGADSDFGRLARIAARRRRLPTWMDVDDVKSQIVALAWHYLFERKCRNGSVGFDPGKYRSAGSYCRWKVQRKVAKSISRAKGENQHTRLGAGAPEYLSKTGELPDHAGGGAVDVAAECSMEVSKAMRRVCETVDDFVVLDAIAKNLGDERSCVSYMVENRAFPSSKEAREAMKKFEAKAVAARKRPREIAA